MPVADLLPEIVLLLGAVTIVLAAAFSPHARQHWAAAIALVVLVLAAGITLAQWGGPERATFHGVWLLDRAALAAKLLILASTALVVLLSPEWMCRDRRHGEYYGLLLFAALGALMMASAGDLMELLVGVLLSSAAGYPLAAYHRAWGPSLEAGMKFYLIAALANALLTVGVVLLFGRAGDTGYPAVAAALAAGGGMLVPAVAGAFLVVGLAFKMGAFPAHSWMPDVAQGAPAPVAGFLTVVPKIGAAVALARLAELLPPELAWRGALALVAVVTMTLGNLAAVAQQDVRRLLGWSAVSQSGYALMAVAVVGLTPAAMPALLLFLAGYAAANLAAFGAVVWWRGRTELEHYRGIAAVQPLAAVLLILALLSLIGVPPLIGFFGKLMLFEAVIDAGFAWLAVAAVVNTVISLYYYLRVVAAMTFGQGAGRVHVLGPWARTGVVTAGVLVPLLGLAVEPLLHGLWSTA